MQWINPKKQNDLIEKQIMILENGFRLGIKNTKLNDDMMVRFLKPWISYQERRQFLNSRRQTDSHPSVLFLNAGALK